MMDDMTNGKADRLVRAAELAEWLGVTRQAVEKHVKAGVLSRDEAGFYPLRESVLAVCQRLAPPPPDSPDARLRAERTALTAAKRELAEMRVAKERDQLVDAEACAERIAKEMTSIRENLSKITARVASAAPSIESEELEILAAEVAGALYGDKE